MRGSLQIGSLLGIPLRFNVSWLLLLTFVVGTLATQVFSEELRGEPAWLLWVVSLAAALILFASMVLHELAHSVLARAFGIPVQSITLFALGAVAQTARETTRAWHEFLMAAAGPAASILLGGLFMLAWLATGQGDGTLSTICAWLWLTNIAVGIFNLIPAYPMDGGRILRAILWGVSGSQRRATHWSALGGRGVGILLIGLGIVVALPISLLDELNPINGIQFMLIGLFINVAASRSDVQSELLDLLDHYRVEDLMIRNIQTSLPMVSVREALDGPLAGYGDHKEWLFISDGNRFTGLALRSVLRAVPDDDQQAAPVGAFAIPAARLMSVATEVRGGELFQRMQAENLSLLVAIAQGEVAGIVHRGMIGALLAKQGRA